MISVDTGMVQRQDGLGTRIVTRSQPDLAPAPLVFYESHADPDAGRLTLKGACGALTTECSESLCASS